MAEPGSIEPLDYRWHDDEWRADPLSWSRQRQDSGTSGNPSGDSRTDRISDPVYQNEADKSAAEAVPSDEQCLVCLGIDPD